MISKIYIDMDGVLCDFDKYVIDNYGDIRYREDANQEEKIQFWAKLWMDSNFFINLERTKYYYELIEYLESLKNIELCILSAPTTTNRELCVQQKRLWLDEEWNPGIPAIFDKNKHYFANETTLLIDDNTEQCSKFKEAGGLVWQYDCNSEESLNGLFKYIEENI